MQVIVFDLLPYGEHLDHLKVNGELPHPLQNKHFKAEVAVKTYAEHLEAWEEMDRLGYDGVGFNEHHTSPYGLMNSPNLMAAAAAQRTKKIKLLIYGNLLPLHQPLRLAEELAMIDCLSEGRLISGVARGIPREYVVHNVPLAESRERFEEAYEIILKAWTEEEFSHQGKYWSYTNVSIWPRPVQEPYPPIWVPITGSKESIEWAGKHNIPITPGGGSLGLREDIIMYYAKCLAENGHTITPEHLNFPMNVYIADSKAQAVKEAGPYHLYFNRTLFSHGNVTETNQQRKLGYVTGSSSDYVRPENLITAARNRADFRNMTMEDVANQAENAPWGTPEEVTERIIETAEHAGAHTVQISLNRGAMPHEMFIEQIRLFADKVLPAVQAHKIASVPLADAAA
ncbi:MAG: LLM class flavin-dependent oxidoreductase [Pseudomonadota bacterium]|nr:LLM class flavin-dependent oxidoreductase [Pseudomonadota bacterium]